MTGAADPAVSDLLGNRRILLFVTGHETTTDLIRVGVATYLVGPGVPDRN